MKINFGHHTPLKAIFLLIIASKHIVVRAGIYNKQSPVTIQHDLFKFIEATKGTPRHQTPSNLQQEFHRFIRKTGGAKELQSSYSSLASLASQPQSSHVPPIKSQSFHVPPTKPKDSGCSTPTGMRRPGEVWFSNGCRRSKCIAFRGNSFIETDQCDTEIYNTVYKCIIEVDIEARFPHCCPKYRCNPDNLGHRVKS